VRPIVGSGTTEERWRTWTAMRQWPELILDPPGPPLVVAPHPDDQILGVAGLLALLGRADLAAVTSDPAAEVQAAAVGGAGTAEALRRLGLGSAAVHRLGHPGGAIDEDRLAGQLAGLLTPGRWCLVTWRGDGHPDHEVTGRAAARACAATGARLLEYPIWTWHWSYPESPEVPWDRAHRVDLPPAARTAKAAAIAAFRGRAASTGPGRAGDASTGPEPTPAASTGPEPGGAAGLPAHVVARFTRPFEVIFA
jgi:LmbE family N-acetylglucosaminyl deacetylase